MYSKEGKPTAEEMKIEKEEEVESDRLGPEMLKSEIEEAIKQIKVRKAEGLDEIPAEMIKGINESANSELICLWKCIKKEYG